MCLCSLGNILDVGAKGTVQGGDVGAVGTVFQKDVRAFGTVVQKDSGTFGAVNQKDVVAAGTVRKSVSAVSHQSSVISPGPRVSDPMLGVGDGRCTGDIPPSPGCAASRPHEHTTGGAVSPGTVSLPEVSKRPPRYISPIADTDMHRMPASPYVHIALCCTMRSNLQRSLALCGDKLCCPHSQPLCSHVLCTGSSVHPLSAYNTLLLHP